MTGKLHHPSCPARGDGPCVGCGDPTAALRSRLYGPHRPEDVPAGVVVLAVGRYWRDGLNRGERVVPFPAELATQRANLNARAHRAGL